MNRDFKYPVICSGYMLTVQYYAMSANKERIHPMDNLRGILAMLGIPFHASFFLYLSSALFSGHLITNRNQFLLEPVPATVKHAFLIIFYLHTFWMPAFFLLAGFFAHLLCTNKGTKHFIKNRSLRIGLPFIFYFLWLIPCYLVKILGVALTENKTFLSIVEINAHNGQMWIYFNNLTSYWFLDYLLWFYGLTLVFLLLKKAGHFPHTINRSLHHGLEKLFSTRFIYAFIPIICATLFLRGHHWFIMLDENIMPSPDLLVFYSIWYFIGWFLWEHQKILSRLSLFSWQKMLFSFALYLFYLVCYFHFIHAQDEWLYVFSILVYTASMTFAVFGCLGMAWRFLPTYHAVLKYLSKASYWLYLTQIPILWFLSLIMMGVTHSFYVQFAVTTLLCMMICLVSYHFFIRRTRLQKLVG